MKNLKQILDNITDELMVGIVAFAVIATSIAFAVVQDQARINETQEFVNIVSDTREENEANIQNYINNNLK